MTIYQIAVDFLTTLIGTDIASTARGALVTEYFGYIVVGITVFMLIRVALWLLSIPVKAFKDR